MDKKEEFLELQEKSLDLLHKFYENEEANSIPLYIWISTFQIVCAQMSKSLGMTLEEYQATLGSTAYNVKFIFDLNNDE